jgi:hypothetical protein
MERKEGNRNWEEVDLSVGTRNRNKELLLLVLGSLSSRGTLTTTYQLLALLVHLENQINH